VSCSAVTALPLLGSESFLITSSRLKLAGFWRTGNSLSVDSQFATIPWLRQPGADRRLSRDERGAPGAALLATSR
jgi:hypothetical protein